MTRAQMRARFTMSFNPALKVVALIDKANEMNTLTITNDAENVVAWLVDNLLLRDGEHLVYCDTDGNWDEILHQGGKFKGWKFLKARTMTDAAIKAVEPMLPGIAEAVSEWHQ
jgi:hypothetical protein